MRNPFEENESFYEDVPVKEDRPHRNLAPKNDAGKKVLKYGVKLDPHPRYIRAAVPRLEDDPSYILLSSGPGRKRAPEKEKVERDYRTRPRNEKIPRPNNPPRISAAPKFRSMPMAGSMRRCIVKAMMKGYRNGGAGAFKGNVRLANQRLSSFPSNNSKATGYRVFYIGREEALEGVLFSTVKTDELLGYEGNIAVGKFGADPTYSFVLSPEDPGCDLIALTKRFMGELYPKHAAGIPKAWVAGIHGNTDHKHVHILVSCVDSKGNDARMDYNYIKSGRLQTDTSKLLTEIQGRRSWYDEFRSQRAAMDRKRLIPIDEYIFKAINSREQDPQDPVLLLSDIEKKGNLHNAVSRRLQELKRHGLCSRDYEVKGKWHFAANAEDVLRSADFEREFKLTRADIGRMKIDAPSDNGYSGTIIQTAPTLDGKYMLFMIQDNMGNVIHLHRERIVSEKQALLYERLKDVQLAQMKNGLSMVLHRDKGGRK